MTTKRFAVLTCLTFVVGGCGERTPEMELIYEAAEAMGGQNVIVRTETLLLEGEGQQYRLGQNSAPGDDSTLLGVG